MSVERDRKAVVLALMEAASRLSVRPGMRAAELCQACWRQVALIEEGCRCYLVGPNGVLAEAESFLTAVVPGELV